MPPPISVTSFCKNPSQASKRLELVYPLYVFRASRSVRLNFSPHVVGSIVQYLSSRNAARFFTEFQGMIGSGKDGAIHRIRTDFAPGPRLKIRHVLHFQNSLELLNLWTNMGKQVEFMVYPESRHGIRQFMHQNESNQAFWFKHFLDRDFFAEKIMATKNQKKSADHH